MHCDHGEHCGGCSLLAVPEPDQLAAKRAAVAAALARYPRLRALEPAPTVPACPSTAYRTRAKLVADARGALGLYARGSHDVVDIPRCQVLAPALMRTAAALRERIAARPGALFGADLREVRDGGETAVLVTLLGPARALPALRALAGEVASVPGVAGVALGRHDPKSPAFLGDPPEVATGAPAARDRLSARGPYHLATYGGFVQAHRGQAEAIAVRVIDGLARALGTLDGARVLELHAGAGAFGLELAARGARPLLVERFAPALALAEQAAREQGLAALRTRSGDAARVAADLARTGERFGAVVVNPPRRGLPPALRAAIAGLAPRAIAYVSCDPETLARDLDQLALRAYVPRSITPFDMIPWSAGVECLVLLERAQPAEIAILHEDDELLAVEKPPHLPTTPQGDGAGSLLEHVSAQRGLAKLHAVHRLDAGTSGVCLLAKRPAAVPALSAALRDGQKHYLALARGITRDKGSINRPLRDGDVMRDARTRYRRLEVAGGHSLLRVQPDQGRTHQIRRHLAAIDHPVLGDARYGHAPSNRHFEQKHGLDRAFLHLARIELAASGGRAALVLEAPLAGDLEAVLRALGHTQNEE